MRGIIRPSGLASRAARARGQGVGAAQRTDGEHKGRAAVAARVKLAPVGEGARVVHGHLDAEGARGRGCFRCVQACARAAGRPWPARQDRWLHLAPHAPCRRSWGRWRHRLRSTGTGGEGSRSAKGSTGCKGPERRCSQARSAKSANWRRHPQTRPRHAGARSPARPTRAVQEQLPSTLVQQMPAYNAILAFATGVITRPTSLQRLLLHTRHDGELASAAVCDGERGSRWQISNPDQTAIQPSTHISTRSVLSRVSAWPQGACRAAEAPCLCSHRVRMGAAKATHERRAARVCIVGRVAWRRCVATFGEESGGGFSAEVWARVVGVARW